MKDIPAFPFNELNQQTGFVHVQHLGMTLRDYFAAKVMHRLIADPSWQGMTTGTMAATAYEVADAMLAAREAK